jgi:hypothetical protein
VKFARLWNRRSREYEQLQQSLTDLESAVTALASELASAHRSAASVDQSARTLRYKLDELEQEEDRSARPARVLRLGALCAGLLLLAGGLTYTGVKGFANPLAVSSGQDSIALAVRVPTPTFAQQGQADPSAGSAYIYATFGQNNDATDYEILVPAKDAGQQYALMLMGTALLDHPTDYYASFQSRLTTCTTTAAGWSGPPQQQCQLITGRFPSKANGYLPGPDVNRCQGEGYFNTPVAKAPNAVEMNFQGRSQLSTALSWAYQQYYLPGMTAWDSGVSGYQDSLNGISLAGWYELTTIGGCREDDLPENVDLTDIDTPATQSTGDQLHWNGPQIFSTALVVRRRDADEIGNALLAAGAATAALAIGFVPVVYDADRERRKARKRRRTRHGAHSA